MIRSAAFFVGGLFAALNFGWAGPIEWRAIDVSLVNSGVTPYPGVLKRALSYKDADGVHLVLLSQQEKTSSENVSSKRIEYRELAATSFVFINDGWNTEWIVKDNVNCPGLDSEMSFFYEQVQIDDVNDDGIAEVYLPYHFFCGGGLDPSVVKIIMKTDHLKFAARGESTIVMEGQKDYGGYVKFDKSLDEPRYRAFKKRMSTLWKIVSVERH